jgi:hypothetical protein
MAKVFGGSLGGPIVKNKAFFFANLERTLNSLAANLNFPAEAAPLAVNYSDSTDIKAWNSFIRTDYQVTPKHSLSFRWLREAALTLGEGSGTTTAPNNILSRTTTISSSLQLDGADRQCDERVLGHPGEPAPELPTLRRRLQLHELNGRDAFDVG